MRRHRRQIKENPWQNVHRNTTEAREFITAAIVVDRELAGMIEESTPELRTELAEIWVNYLVFLRSEFGEDGAQEHWRAFCEYSTIGAELETS